MEKLKTHKSASKRFKVTKNGKVLRKKAYNRHLKTIKSAKKKRHLRKTTLVASVEARKVKEMLPYA